MHTDGSEVVWNPHEINKNEPPYLIKNTQKHCNLGLIDEFFSICTTIFMYLAFKIIFFFFFGPQYEVKTSPRYYTRISQGFFFLFNLYNSRHINKSSKCLNGYDPSQTPVTPF